jgi:hypothetical protein
MSLRRRSGGRRVVAGRARNSRSASAYNRAYYYGVEWMISYYLHANTNTNSPGAQFPGRPGISHRDQAVAPRASRRGGLAAERCLSGLRETCERDDEQAKHGNTTHDLCGRFHHLMTGNRNGLVVLGCYLVSGEVGTEGLTPAITTTAWWIRPSGRSRSFKMV